MKLINLSNHPSEKWNERQKAEFEKIIDLSFPIVSPHASAEEIFLLAEGLTERICQIAEKENTSNLCLLGEYSLCFSILKKLQELTDYFWYLWVPTTERQTKEIQTPTGVQKISTFEFVRWRIIPLKGGKNG